MARPMIGRPTKVWGVKIDTYGTGVDPKVGDAVEVRTNDGRKWYSRITQIVSKHARGTVDVLTEDKASSEGLTQKILAEQAAVQD